MLRMEAEFLKQLIAISTHKKAYSDGQKLTTNHFIISKVYYLFSSMEDDIV